MISAQDTSAPLESGKAARRFAWLLGGTALLLLGFALGTGGSWMKALREAQAGDKFEVMPYVKSGLWWASVVNAGCCAILAATARIWTGGGGEGAIAPERRPDRTSKRGLVLLVGISILAGGVRWLRMDLSFYNDEAHTFRRYIAGKFHDTEEGELKWKKVSWLDTVWLNEVGNNLMPCSIFGRICYDAWIKMSHAPAGWVSETAVRLPAWVTGMASLVVLWLLARRLLPVSGAWWVLALGALHPWMVRYSTEARGYGFLLLGVSLAFYFLQRALEDGRWRWWLGFGFAQFLCVWGFPGAVYFLMVLDALLVLHQLARWKGGAPTSVVWRPLAGILLGGMLTLQVMLPSLLQLVEAMRALDSVKGSMGRPWWLDVLGGLGFGIRGVDQDPGNPENLALLRMLAQEPFLWVVVVISAVFWLLGALELAKRPGVGLLAAVSGPLAVGLSWALMSAQGKYLHPWYVIYAAPGVVLALAAGLEWFGRWREMGMSALGKVSLPLLALFWLSLDLHYARMGKENLRGLTETARGERYSKGWAQKPGQGVFAAMLSDANVYDPHVRVIKASAEVDALIAEARHEKHPLYISVGHVGIGDSPLLFRRLKESGEFDPVRTLPGLEEEQFTHYLFKLHE